MLSDLGVEPGSAFLFHASFARLSRQGFIPERVLESFLTYLAGGTLLVPTLSWREVSPEQPVFDMRTTRSNVGILSEVFRIEFSEYRSLHPTHSMAGAGSHARGLLTEPYQDNRPCGPSSPWAGLAKLDARILMINVDMDTCTLVHHLEETFDPGRYLRDEVETYDCVTANGALVSVATQRHRKLYRNFWKFREVMERRGLCRTAMLLDSKIIAFRAADLIAVGSEMFEIDRGASLAAPGERSKLM